MNDREDINSWIDVHLGTLAAAQAYEVAVRALDKHDPGNLAWLATHCLGHRQHPRLIAPGNIHRRASVASGEIERT